MHVPLDDEPLSVGQGVLVVRPCLSVYEYQYGVRSTLMDDCSYSYSYEDKKPCVLVRSSSLAVSIDACSGGEDRCVRAASEPCRCFLSGSVAVLVRVRVPVRVRARGLRDDTL